jgi:hypothetical protein
LVSGLYGLITPEPIIAAGHCFAIALFTQQQDEGLSFGVGWQGHLQLDVINDLIALLAHEESDRIARLAARELQAEFAR